MAALALALGPQIFGQGFRFLPAPQDAVTYYLPRLVAGAPLHDAVRAVVHHADVYASAPAALARRFCPLPKTGDRFFFSPRGAPGAAAHASGRAGSWQAQNTVGIKGRGDAKVGELRKLRFKNRGGGGYTDWLMDEYSSCSGDDDGEGQFVLCKMYVSPRAAPTSAAHQESAAYFFSFTLPPPLPMQPAPAPAPKRPAPPRPAMSPPCAKRMRGPAELLARSAAQPPPAAPPAPTLSSRTAIRNHMPFAPPQPCAPRRGSTTLLATQPSPASAPPPAPPAPARTPLATVRITSFAPPQPSCAPRRSSTTPLATQPSPVPAPLLAPPGPIRRSPTPPQPPPQMKQVPLLPTPLVVRACHVPQQLLQVPVQPKQRRILDPFEAAMLRDEEAEEEQTVAAAPHLPPPPPAATPALQDEDDWGDLEKALEFEE